MRSGSGTAEREKVIDRFTGGGATFGLLALQGLLERGDVPKGAQEQHDHVALVLDGRDLEQQPQRRPCWMPTGKRSQRKKRRESHEKKDEKKEGSARSDASKRLIR